MVERSLDVRKVQGSIPCVPTNIHQIWNISLLCIQEKRKRERSITCRLIEEALDDSTDIGTDSEGKVLIKKLYQRMGKDRLLLVVGEFIQKDIFKVITIIETSKIDKYL